MKLTVSWINRFVNVKKFVTPNPVRAGNGFVGSKKLLPERQTIAIEGK